MLADAEMQVLACRGYRARNLPRPRTSEWSCSTVRDPPSRQETKGCSAQGRSAPCPKRLGPRCLSDRPGTPEGCGPSRREVRAAASARSRLRVGILGSIGGEEFRPLLPGLRTARADPGGEVLVDAIGHKKLRVLGPAIGVLGEPDLLVAERLAVGRGSVLLVRGAVADVAVQNNERGPVLRLAKDVEGVLDALDVVGVADPQDVPAVSQKSRLDVLCKGDARVPLDGDVVVVVDPAKVVEAQVTGQRRCFRRDALHQAAVSANGIDVVVEDLKAGPVVPVGEPLLGDGHADARRNALSKWTGRRLNARNPVILGVPRSFAVELAEVTDILERNRRVAESFVIGIHRLCAGEMEHGPEQHRGVAVREHEPIAVGPDRVLRDRSA